MQAKWQNLNVVFIRFFLNFYIYIIHIQLKKQKQAEACFYFNNLEPALVNEGHFCNCFFAGLNN